MESGVYLIRNKKSGKVYVGSSCDLSRRLKEHKTRLRCDVHANEYMQRAFNKDGEDSFELAVLERCLRDELLVVEQWWIDKYDSTNEEFGYNLLPTRSSPLYSEASSPLRKKAWHAMPEHKKRRIIRRMLSVRNTADYREKVADGKRNSEKFTAVRKEVAARTIASEATRKKNSERLKRLWQDPEFRAKRLIGLARGRAKTNARRKTMAMK